MKHGAFTYLNSSISGRDVLEILRYIPQRPHYGLWVKIISAVGSALPPAEAANVLATWSPEEQPGEYTEKLRRRIPGIGIGSLINLAKAGGYDASAAARRRCRGKMGVSLTTKRPPVRTSPPPVKPPIKWPKDMRLGNEDELYALADSRDIPDIQGLKAACDAGILFFGTLPDVIVHEEAGAAGWLQCPAWLLADSSRKIALARRMDGKPWHHVNGKGWLLKGSEGRWPIGIAEAAKKPCIGIVEGGPDMLALFHLTATGPGFADVAPVCMASGSSEIAEEALPIFANKEVILFCHNDATGRESMRRWRRQLASVHVAKESVFNFSRWYVPPLMREVKDLNELLAFQAQDILAMTENMQQLRETLETVSANEPLPAPQTPELCPLCKTNNIIAPLNGPTCPHSHLRN